MQLGMIGLGRMGASMVRRLIQSAEPALGLNVMDAEEKGDGSTVELPVVLGA